MQYNIYKSFNMLMIILVVEISLFIGICCQDPTDTEPQILTVPQRWGFGVLAGFGISLVGFLAALILVVIKKIGNDQCFSVFVKFFYSLSCGALLGDAIVHILAQAYQNQSVLKTIVSLIFICSIGFFLLLERLFHACGIAHTHWHQDKDGQGKEQHSHSHDFSDSHHDENQSHTHQHNNGQNHEDHNHNHQQVPKKTNQESKKNKKQLQPNSNENIGSAGKIANNHVAQINLEPSDLINGVRTSNPNTELNQQEEKNCIQALKGKGAAGYLNLLGSLIHNFLDGLALGVAFATGQSGVFVPLLVAIIVHQIPRELGDVAILMKSKFSGIQTILCNGIINFISILGVIIGLAIINLDEATNIYILVFVAGNFTFVAADVWRRLFRNKKFLFNILEMFGLVVGVGSMFLLLKLEG